MGFDCNITFLLIQVFERQAPKTTQCIEHNLSTERRLEQSREFRNQLKFKQFQREEERRKEEERKRELEEQEISKRIISISSVLDTR